jgi:hypothetical protein
MTHFLIPESDNQEFESLPKHIRREVQRWLLWLYEIEKEKPAGPAIRRIAEKNHLKVQTIYHKWRIYRRYDWRGLVNRAKFPLNPPPASSKTFLRFLHALWLANEKNYKNTHRQLVAIWKGKAPIPGYKDLPTKSPFNNFPDGWTSDNLRYHIITYREIYPEEIPAD